jgi:hypothetical protein
MDDDTKFDILESAVKARTGSGELENAPPSRARALTRFVWRASSILPPFYQQSLHQL